MRGRVSAKDAQGPVLEAAREKGWGGWCGGSGGGESELGLSEAREHGAGPGLTENSSQVMGFAPDVLNRFLETDLTGNGGKETSFHRLIEISKSLVPMEHFWT